MKLTKKEVEHIALLARVKLSNAEKEKLADELSGILDYVRQLQEVETKNVSETAQVGGAENAVRGDLVGGCTEASRAQILKNVPEIDDNLFKTKTVFE